jgi:Ca2+-binding RTX toxin-like protein
MKTILPPQGRLLVEQLEDRNLPSTVVLNAGVLTITGTNLRDEVEVYRTNSTTLAVWDSGKVTTFSFAAVTQIQFTGLDGDDYFSNFTVKPTNADGGAGHDWIEGGDGADTLIGGLGNDYINGWGGVDNIQGNDGHDVLFGGLGKDTLNGGTGNDYLAGGEDPYWYGYYVNDGQADVLTGGPGADTFVAEWRWNGFAWYNLDQPQDFSAAEGDRLT